MYLVLSALTSSPISLVAATKASAFSFKVCIPPPGILTLFPYNLENEISEFPISRRCYFSECLCCSFIVHFLLHVSTHDIKLHLFQILCPMKSSYYSVTKWNSVDV